MANKAGNPQNFKSTAQMTPEERKEMSAKGGRAKAENIRRRKAMKEQLELLLQLPVYSKAGKSALKKNAVTDPELSDNQAAMMAVALNKALSGNIEFMQFIRDTVGEKPTDKMETSSREVVFTFDNMPDKSSVEDVMG